ncbi:MAG: tetratricopeptide repeat protein [Sphingorhabdus sp.]
MKVTRFPLAIAATCLLAACNIGGSNAPDAQLIEQVYERGNFGKARGLIASAFKAGESNGKIRLIAAQVDLARGDGTGAETSLHAAKSAGIAEKTILPLLAEAQARQQRPEKAIASAKKSGRKATIAFVRGLNAWAANKPWDAREALEEAYRLDSTNHRLAIDLARARSELGLFPEAREAVRRVQKAQPENIIAALTLGDIDMRARDYKAAEAAFIAALNLAPGSNNAQAGLAGALYAQKKFGAALKRLHGLPKGVVQRPEMQLLAGKIAVRQARYANARTHFANARDLVESDSEAMFLSGKTLLKLGQPWKAIHLMEGALRSRPDLPEYHGGLIRAYRAAGDESAAQAKLAAIPGSIRRQVNVR